ncbi:MAG TPA: helix-hairpin-helix domain-containing protein [Tepidisphaeraceae bacterium]
MLQAWTPSQRIILATFVLLLGAFLAFRLHHDRQLITNPQTGDGPRAAELVTHVDPNTAPLSNLALIPGLGEKRAKAIIDYRDTFRATRPKEKPFQTPMDLLKVKGMGVSMVENVSPYMVFPVTRPANK